MARNSRRILIVDDSPDDRVFIKRLISKTPDVNWTCLEATKGQTGLALALDEQPDCILLDYHLPDMNAIAFLESLREQAGEPVPATIVLTGSGDDAFAVLAIRSGAQDYFPKRALTSGLLSQAIANAISRFELLQERVEARQSLERSTRQLELANDELRRSNESLNFFAHAASHDLQSPLQSVSVLTTLLARKYGGREAQGDELIQNIVSSMGRMQKLVRDLLAYAQVGAECDRGDGININTAVNGAISDLEEQIKAAGAEIVVDQLPYVSLVQGRQIFQNLIDNALKYRRRGVPPRIEISARPERDCWTISVRDNGQGFNAKHSALVFQPFKRLHGTDYSGSGIGLAICQRVVERNGGRIWVETQLGSGTTFYFTIPMQSAEQSRAGSGLIAEARSANG